MILNAAQPEAQKDWRCTLDRSTCASSPPSQPDVSKNRSSGQFILSNANICVLHFNLMASLYHSLFLFSFYVSKSSNNANSSDNQERAHDCGNRQAYTRHMTLGYDVGCEK